MVSAVRSALVIGIFVICSPAVASSTDDPGNLNKIYSPWIEGDTLYIKGTIDSHIYDYLAMQAADVAKVRVIDLNSFGGNSEWAMNIAKKIINLDKDTRLGSGHVCASACVFLYAAGKRRIAAADTWIGIHGVRLGAGFTTTFEGVCFTELETGSAFMPTKKGCADFVDHWYDVAKKATDDAFNLMESNGVSSSLRQTYYSMPEDPNWPQAMNVIRKPDRPLSSVDALKYSLVTDLTDSAPQVSAWAP